MNEQPAPAPQAPTNAGTSVAVTTSAKQAPGKPIMMMALLCGGALLVGGFVGAGIASNGKSTQSVPSACASAFSYGEDVRQELSSALTGSGEALRAYATGESGALSKMQAQAETMQASSERIKTQQYNYLSAKAECLAGNK